ncbi:MAG: hypothetical protein E7624_05635 [Ruminococcaceae bacterium]|nr:hypothetical protein [Oscillospiraceae bacterium]
MNILHNKKFKHGSVSLALTIVIIAAVILVNAIFTALAQKNLWYIDMTSEDIYSLTDDAKALLEKEFNTEKPVLITFCAEKTILEASAEQRMALHTVLEIAKIYDNIEVRYVDIYTNPSAVQPYKLHTTQTINSQSIIVAATNKNDQIECRVHSLTSLFSFDSSTQAVIGYNGEQRLVSSLLAVTKDELPVACVTTNHGEVDNDNINYLCNALYETGYDIKEIDLTKEDIPEAARLVLIYDPKSDFKTSSTLSDTDELAKLDAFLDARNAVMTFVDNETPYLPNLEDFLEEWGIKIARHEDINLIIQDSDHSLTTSGYTNVGQYVPDTGGLGSSLVSGLTSMKYPKTVVFPSTTTFAAAQGYVSTKDEDHDTWSYTYYENGVTRISYDVFLSSATAAAIAGGQKLRASELEALGLQDPAKLPFSYMRVTRENHDNGDGTMSHSYLLACASTDFARPAALNSNYGNHQLITYACSMMGRDVVSVSLSCKYFASKEITNITASEANQYTVVLTAVPASLVFIAGIVIMIRRRYA